MRAREAPGPPPVLPPPLQLRRWDCCPDRIGPGERTGREAFATREEWIAARHAWRSTRGDGLPAWWEAEKAQARAEVRMLGVLALAPEPDRPDDGWGR